MTVSSDKKSRRSYGGITAEERQRQRRERFIEAGLEVFGRKGVAGATVRELCKQAGFTDRYYYDLFADIETLFAATFESVTAQLVTELYGALFPPEPKLIDAARRGLGAFYAFLQNDPRRARILLIEAQVFYYSGRLHSTITDDPYMSILVPALASRYPGIEKSDLDSTYTLKTLLGIIISNAAVWYFDGMKKSIEDVINNQLFVWNGLDAWLTQLSSGAKVNKN